MKCAQVRRATADQLYVTLLTFDDIFQDESISEHVAAILSETVWYVGHMLHMHVYTTYIYSIYICTYVLHIHSTYCMYVLHMYSTYVCTTYVVHMYVLHMVHVYVLHMVHT